jgi:hypothetical protein
MTKKQRQIVTIITKKQRRSVTMKLEDDSTTRPQETRIVIYKLPLHAA